MQIMSAHHAPDLEETTSITNPEPTVDIRAYGLYGCWEKQSRTLTVWSYAGQHQAKGLLHRTSIALSLARGLSQSDRLFPSVQKNLAWIPIQKQDLACATRRKQRKRGGKRRSGRGGQRRKMRKADRLSKRYFRVCSWNCASANRRGAVLEKMVYDFDVVCLQETRTCPNRPIVLLGFTVIQRHEGRGMAIVVRSNLSKTVSLLNLDKWSTSSRELQGIRIEKPDERHKSLILINAYIHPSTCITGASWDFLVEMEDQLGDTIMICGDFNARSSLWDQHGTNQQGCALEVALSDVLFTPVTTASPTHPGTRQGDTDSTIDLALVSPKLVPWTRTETLASHGSDHLPIVFSLQKPGIEQRRNSNIRSSMVSLTRALCQSCELTSQLAQQIHDRKPPSTHPGGTRKLRQRGLTSGQW